METERRGSERVDEGEGRLPRRAARRRHAGVVDDERDARRHLKVGVFRPLAMLAQRPSWRGVGGRENKNMVASIFPLILSFSIV